MGVTYKLTEEVISYIVALKKQDMALSCRTLSEMATEKFQNNISKSSVNDVLKTYQLSSSVGRRSGEANKLKKFTIPQEKKANIRQDILEKTQSNVSEGFISLPDKKSISSQQTPSKPKINKLGVSQEEIKNIIKNVKDLSKSPEAVNDIKKDQTLVPEPVEENYSLTAEIKNVVHKHPAKSVLNQSDNEFKEKFTVSTQVRERKGHLYNGMGFVLLKAAEWEISDKPFLGNLFKKYVKGPWEKDFEKSCSALTILKMLGIEKLDDTFQYRYHALWRLSGFTDQPAFETIYDWSKYLETPQNLIMEYMNECRQIFFEVSGVQFTLEDGSKVFFDASLTALNDSPEFSSTSLAMTKTLTLLSQFLISSDHVTVFHSCCKNNEFQNTFWDMICAFENVSTKMIKLIEIISGGNNKIADFPVVINKKRFFALGIDSRQKEFKELCKTVHWAPKKQYRDVGTKNEFYISDTRTHWFSERINEFNADGLRLITFWQENSDEPFWMILTNNDQVEAGVIIQQYLNRWPAFNQLSNESRMDLYQKHFEIPDLTEEMSLASIWEIFKDFGLKLHQYVQRHFQSENIPKFSLNDYISDIYSLPGYLIENDRNLIFILSLPPSFKYYQDLLITINKVNQAQVLTHDQRKIRIEIDY